MAGYRQDEKRAANGRWTRSLGFLRRSTKFGPVSGIETFMHRYEQGAPAKLRVVPHTKLLKTQPTVSTYGIKHSGKSHEFAELPGPLGLHDAATGLTHLVDGHHRVYKARKSGTRAARVYTVSY